MQRATIASMLSRGDALSIPRGVEVELAVLGPGEIVGEMSLIGPATRTATITALEDAHGWVLGRATFEFLRDDLRPGSLTLVRRIARDPRSQGDLAGNC